MAEAAVESRVIPVRFFCHKCNIEFLHLRQDYTCPFCSGGFVEQLEGTEPRSPTAQNQPTEDYEIEVSLDDSDDLSQRQETGDRWAHWQPPWNYRSATTPPREISISSELPLLLGGNQIRGVRGTMSFGGPESFLQHLMWQLTGGGAGGSPLLLVSEPSDYVVSGEGLDAVMSQLLWQSEAEGPPPLQQDAIAQLPEISVTSDQVTSKLQCSVCWELFTEDEKVRQLTCGHLYHQPCIAPWLALHATCPICRQSLVQPGSTPEPAPTATSISAPSLAALLLHACGGPAPGAEGNGGGGGGGGGPVASMVSLIRSMSAPSASGSSERRPAAPHQPPPPPPPANYDMDLEFD